MVAYIKKIIFFCLLLGMISTQSTQASWFSLKENVTLKNTVKVAIVSIAIVYLAKKTGFLGIIKRSAASIWKKILDKSQKINKEKKAVSVLSSLSKEKQCKDKVTEVSILPSLLQKKEKTGSLKNRESAVSVLSSLSKEKQCKKKTQAILTLSSCFKKKAAIITQRPYSLAKWPYGIKNINGSCYLNTALQMFLSCGKFIDGLRINKTFYAQNKSSIINELIAFAESINKDSSKLIKAFKITDSGYLDGAISKIEKELNLIEENNPNKNLYFKIDLKANEKNPFSVAPRLITNTKEYKENPTGFILCDYAFNQSMDLSEFFFKKEFGKEFKMKKKILAQLKAIGVHTGGHWYAYSNYKNKWYVCNDSVVRRESNIKLTFPYKWLLYEIIEPEKSVAGVANLDKVASE